jgi:sialidase-1
MRKLYLLATAVVALAGASIATIGHATAQAAAAGHSERLLFDGGGESLNGVTYHSFRIPSIVTTASQSHTLLAFAEGRASGNADYGNINLLFKRSTTNGQSWSGLQQVVGAGQGTWGNPTAVVDRGTNVIWLFMSWNPAGYSQSGTDGTTRITRWEDRKVYLSHSTDDGQSWADPVDLTETLKPRTHADGSVWAWDAVGPGTGVQLTTGAHAGRLVVPAIARNIYSDDHGATWQVARMTDQDTGVPEEGTSEGTVLELSDGSLYRNDRASSYWNEDVASTQRRWVARGTIERGFTAFAPDARLLDPKSEGSVLRYNTDDPTRIAFLNSASTSTRTKMEVKISYTEANTWSCYRTLNDAPIPAASAPGWSGLGSGNVKEGGYSSMAKTADYFIGALVELNENAGDAATNALSHRSIVFRKINLPWILNGHTEPC